MNKFSVATWNVNSVNVRLDHLKGFCKAHNPDVVLLQETKAINEKFPEDEIIDLGYNVSFHGQKSYNGVAILSKSPLDNVEILDFTDGLGDARCIQAGVNFGGRYIQVASIYVPNGSGIKTEKYQAKLDYFTRLYAYMEGKLQAEELFIIGGDYNVAPQPVDVYDPIALRNSIGFHIDERRAFQKILDMGYIDTWRQCNQNVEEYSWWDYRDRASLQNNKGMRIDHVLVNKSAGACLVSGEIHRDYRQMLRPSDHVPVMASFVF